MATVESVQRQIFRVEGFEVRIFALYPDDVRELPRDHQFLFGYSGQDAYWDAWSGQATIEQWRQDFQEDFPGYMAEVLDGGGNLAPGQVLLEALRDSYEPRPVPKQRTRDRGTPARAGEDEDVNDLVDADELRTLLHRVKKMIQSRFRIV